MPEHQIAPQIEFRNLEDFTRRQYNYYAHFLDDCEWGNVYRAQAHFQRFQEANPEMEREVTLAVVRAVRAENRNLPYEKLWESYKLMSKLVFSDDKYVMRDGKIDDCFLIR